MQSSDPVPYRGPLTLGSFGLLTRPRLARFLVLLLVMLCGVPAMGAMRHRKGRAVRRARAPQSQPRSFSARRDVPASASLCSAALVVEAESGKVLFEKNPDEPRAPASLTKMMTELLTLEAIDKGKVSLSDVVTVPPDVRTVGGSRIRLRPGERLSLNEAVRAMAIASANDAAVTVACHVAGSVDRFIDLMNQRARELGMLGTHYVSVNGLDRPDRPTSITTARDQSILARTLIEHPFALEVSSTVYDTIRAGQVIHTTNRLLGRCEGVDGLKTGYTNKAGFCLVSTAHKGDLRVVSVVLGATSNRRRFSVSETLLNQAFAEYQKVSVIRKGQDLGRACATLGGDPPQVRLVAGEDVSVVLPVSKRPEITLRVDAPASIQPPVDEGKPVGQLQVLIGDSLAVAAPAVAARPVHRAGLLDRIIPSD